MKRRWYVHAIDREAFIHPFPQAVGRVRVFPLQLVRESCQLRHPVFRLEPPRCSHRRFGLFLLILRQPFGDVPQFVLATFAPGSHCRTPH